MTATPLQGATAVVGSKIRAARKAKKLSRAELAVKASETGEPVGIDTVGNVEREEHDVSVAKLRAICLVLGLTTDEVLR